MPSSWGNRCLLVVTLGLCLAALASRHMAVAQETAPEEVVSPLVATPIASPNPMLGADNKVHLAYEMVLLNMAPVVIGLKKIETLDVGSGAVLGTLEGDGMVKMLKLNGGGKGSALPGGGSGILFMDVTLPKDATTSRAIKHRFDIEVAKAEGGKNAGDHDPAPEPPQALAFTGDPLPVGPAAVVIAPPLKGSRWVAGGGCCALPSYHRGATLPINGAIQVAERYAIDFVQLNEKNMLISGPMEQLSSYAYFGDEIYSVAEGTVVGTADGLPERVPGKLPADATIQMAAGNHVVVVGRFAFYAHMHSGSVRVKLATRSRPDKCGLLGNSGNTDTPHLHFHMMDGPSPLSPMVSPTSSPPLPARAS